MKWRSPRSSCSSSRPRSGDGRPRCYRTPMVRAAPYARRAPLHPTLYHCTRMRQASPTAAARVDRGRVFATAPRTSTTGNSTRTRGVRVLKRASRASPWRRHQRRKLPCQRRWRRRRRRLWRRLWPRRRQRRRTERRPGRRRRRRPRRRRRRRRKRPRRSRRRSRRRRQRRSRRGRRQ